MNKPPSKPRKGVCISIQLDDIARADQMIEGLKRDGFTKMNRSLLIRLALEQFDASKLDPQDNYR